MAITKKKKVDKIEAWDKVWVISGEPCMARLSLNSLIEENGIKKTKRFYKDSDIKFLRSSLTTFSMIKDLAIIVYDPNAEMLRICQEAVENNCVAVKMLIVATIGDSLDGRASFAVKAKKNSRIMDFSYIEAKDTIMLGRHIKNWEQGSEVTINPQALKWIYSNAPITIAKVKGEGGKKDAEVYDLGLLEAELDKITYLCNYEGRNMELSDVQTYCDFNQVADVWDFIRLALNGDYKQSRNLLDKLLDQQGLNSALWLLYSQLCFLIQLKHFVNEYGDSVDGLVNKMTYKQYLGKYYDDNWQECEPVNEPTVNFWRIKMAVQSSNNWTVENLVTQYNAVTNAILDMRASGSEDIVIPYLLLSLSGKANYSVPLYNIL
jgi:DNA polymerase III delta subunit